MGSGTDARADTPLLTGRGGAGPGLFIPVGFAGLVSQVVFLRETLSVFENSEYFLAFFWFVWLTANGLGLVLRGRAGRKPAGPSGPLLLYSLFLIAGFFVLRLCHILLSHGRTAAGFASAAAIVTFALAAVSFLNGRVFRAFSDSADPSDGLSTLKLYYNETVGFILSGLTLLAALSFVPDFFLLLASCGLLGIPLLTAGPPRDRRNAYLLWAGLAILGLAYPLLNRAIFSGVYPRYELKSERTSPYARLDILGYGGEEYAVYAGKPLGFEHEPGADEELLYPALSAFTRSVNVLVNGPAILNFLPSLQTPAVGSVTVSLADGILASYLRTRLAGFTELSGKTRWIRTPVQEISEGKFDIVFLDLARASKLEDTVLLDPATLKKLKRSMAPDGVLQVSIPAEGASVSEFGGHFAGSVNNSLKAVFGETRILLLENHTLLLASDRLLKTDIGSMLTGIGRMGVRPVYFNAFNTGSRIESATNIGLKRILSVGALNSLSRPEVYLNGLVMNLSEYGLSAGLAFGRILLGFQDRPVLSLVTLVLLLIAVILAVWRRNRQTAVTMTSGAGHLGLQISLFYLFQMRFGGLYQNLGLLTSVMMVGLVVGLTVSRTAIKLRTGLLVSCLIAAGLTAGLLAAPDHRLIFFILSLVTGFNQGLVFGLMNAESPREKGTVLIYAAEMTGAGFASLVIPLLIVPVFGFPVLFLLIFGLIVPINLAYLLRNQGRIK